jgi:hypothetical protein
MALRSIGGRNSKPFSRKEPPNGCTWSNCPALLPISILTEASGMLSSWWSWATGGVETWTISSRSCFEPASGCVRNVTSLRRTLVNADTWFPCSSRDRTDRTCRLLSLCALRLLIFRSCSERGLPLNKGTMPHKGRTHLDVNPRGVFGYCVTEAGNCRIELACR